MLYISADIVKILFVRLFWEHFHLKYIIINIQFTPPVPILFHIIWKLFYLNTYILNDDLTPYCTLIKWCIFEAHKKTPIIQMNHNQYHRYGTGMMSCITGKTSSIPQGSH